MTRYGNKIKTREVHYATNGEASTSGDLMFTGLDGSAIIVGLDGEPTDTIWATTNTYHTGYPMSLSHWEYQYSLAYDYDRPITGNSDAFHEWNRFQLVIRKIRKSDAQITLIDLPTLTTGNGFHGMDSYSGYRSNRIIYSEEHNKAYFLYCIAPMTQLANGWQPYTPSDARTYSIAEVDLTTGATIIHSNVTPPGLYIVESSGVRGGYLVWGCSDGATSGGSNRLFRVNMYTFLVDVIYDSQSYSDVLWLAGYEYPHPEFTGPSNQITTRKLNIYTGAIESITRTAPMIADGVDAPEYGLFGNYRGSKFFLYYGPVDNASGCIFDSDTGEFSPVFVMYPAHWDFLFTDNLDKYMYAVDTQATISRVNIETGQFEYLGTFIESSTMPGDATYATANILSRVVATETQYVALEKKGTEPGIIGYTEAPLPPPIEPPPYEPPTDPYITIYDPTTGDIRLFPANSPCGIALGQWSDGSPIIIPCS